MTRLSATVVAWLACACGSAPPPIVETRAPSTAHDPPTWSPHVSTETTTGEPSALAPSGDAEQARGLLRSLVIAIRDGDVTSIEEAFADRIVHAQPSITRTTWTRASVVEQIVAGAAAAHVEPGTTFDELIDPATVRIADAASVYGATLPTDVAPSDQVVQFAPSALGRRLLAGLGTSALVIRPGPSPVIVAR